MSIRTKLLLVFLACGVAPMLALAVANYLNGRRTVERLLLDDAQASATRMAQNIERQLADRELNLDELARLRSLREYVRAASKAQAPAEIPEAVRDDVGAFYLNYRRYYAAITCLDARKRPLFRVENLLQTGGRAEVRFKTAQLEPAQADERVWRTEAPVVLRSPIERENYGAALRYTIPIFLAGPAADAPRGALVAELKLSAIFEEAAADAMISAREELTGSGLRVAMVLDRTGLILFHTDDSLKYQPVKRAMPEFEPLLKAIFGAGNGTQSYRSSDGTRWLIAYRPTALGLAVITGANESRALMRLERAALTSITLSLALAFIAASVLVVIINRTARRIARVAEGAAAIASGDLDQRIKVNAKDETRVLADSFNRMSEQLRELIAREAEARQFEAFTRLSAMLTHDLKNAITSLSMLVRNMERQFHREEFRQDAVISLREATDKLRRIVARLNAPAEARQIELQRKRAPTDLCALIRRVLDATAERAAPLYEIETHLPATLPIRADAEAIERVIENLIINAMEAMGANGGRLTIEAGEEGDHVFFSVADTGRGMDEEFIRNRLFRPFATTKDKGIGLGLYTCREIVEAHGGRIEVESRVGVGTRFRVVLPSSPSDDQERV
ncbi:MAG: HAMP domain-containing protein [Pyrinomonas methylaliphatogenes]|nr:HAMP domain-containing protein [Pyrinomonas methylaliphatogenes]